MAIESNRNQDVNGDVLQTIDVWGKDGTNRVLAAQIKFIVDGAVGVSAIPTRIEFWTATSGGTLTKAATLDASQILTFVNGPSIGGVFKLNSLENTITAHSGGTQAAAFALSATKSVHNVTVVAAGNDSVVLPASTGGGAVHWVKNSAGANSLQLYGLSTDTIDGVTASTGVAVAAGKSRLVIDVAAGIWLSLLGA